MSSTSRPPGLSLLALALSVGVVVSISVGSEVSLLLAAVQVVVLALSIWSWSSSKSSVPNRGFGDYELQEKLGEGGMGEVFRARHAQLRRVVALKKIKRVRMTLEERARLKREARVLSGLSNPHTINVFDAGIQPDGTFYYVMELLDGLDLEKLVQKQGPLQAPRVIHILRQATMSLSEAHKKGLVHRDLKPANLMVCRYGGEYDFVKVLDFGLVKGGAQESDTQDAITQRGEIPGTPAFLAPESVLGQAQVTSSVDIYALGALGHYLLTGNFLFKAQTPLKMIQSQLNDVPLRASETSVHPVPPELDELLAQCLKKDPRERPLDADALLARLEELSAAHFWSREDAVSRWNDVPVRAPTPYSHMPLLSDFDELAE